MAKLGFTYSLIFAMVNFWLYTLGWLYRGVWPTIVGLTKETMAMLTHPSEYSVGWDFSKFKVFDALCLFGMVIGFVLALFFGRVMVQQEQKVQSE
jgi:hypothetical protein